MFSIATHNGKITVENTKRGTHRTFRIHTQPKDSHFAPGERILSLMTGPDNENSYTGIGFVKSNGTVILYKKCRTDYYYRLVDVLQRPAHYRELGCEYHYEGRCRVCNRTLTTPESIESGIGPICAGRI